MEKLSIRAVGIVIHNGQILVMQRERGKDIYFVFPSGGVEADETIKEAVIREVKEEFSIDIKIGKLVYKHYLNHSNGIKSEQYFYLCSYVKGKPKLGDSNEREDMRMGKKYYKPQWIPLNKIKDTLLYPLEVRDCIIEDIDDNFMNTPRASHLRVEELRQE
jgi:mutator protein MutT